MFPKGKKLGKGKAPMLTKSKSKSSPSFGDRMSGNAGKTKSVKDLIAQKKGADGTAVKTEKKDRCEGSKKKTGRREVLELKPRTESRIVKFW